MTDMVGRLRNRVDENHSTIVAAFRLRGVAVQSLAPIGFGCPDLLVCKPARTAADPPRMALVEIKDGTRSPSKQALTPDEIAWHALWPGPVFVVRSVADVETVIESM